MASLNRYPRGYISKATAATLLSQGKESTNQSINDVPCDPGVVDLYNNYMSNRSYSPNWDFKNSVIKRACILFGDFNYWLNLQFAGNDNIYDLNLAFLEDTVGFIRTGKREMSIQNWQSLLLENPDPVYGCASPERLKALKIVDASEFSNFIGQWCHWDGGFNDMLCTLNTVFGVSKSPIVTRSL